MGAPVKHDVTITGVDESDWLPLNRWGSALARIHVEVTGTATYSLVGTHENVLRGETAEELTIASHTDNTATTQTTENLVYEAVKLKVTAGTGSARLRLQTEGDD